MRGLKTQEGAKFNRFFRLIQDEARKHNAVFFAFAGEGREIFLPDIECDDMSGWLIPMEKADEFEKEWNVDNSGSHLEKWSDYFTWAEWSEQNGVISVQFNSYD